MGEVGNRVGSIYGLQTYKDIKLSKFKRLCGVYPQTFNQMLEVVRTHETNNKKQVSKKT